VAHALTLTTRSGGRLPNVHHELDVWWLRIVARAQDQFIASGPMHIIGQLRPVTMNRFVVTDRLLRARFAKAVAAVIS